MISAAKSHYDGGMLSAARSHFDGGMLSAARFTLLWWYVVYSKVTL